MKYILSFIFAFLFSVSGINAHPWKPNHFVIIDTDGGVDDFRAISMLLASTDVRVLGITVTSGVLPATEAYARVKAMLKMYSHEGVPVGINDAPEIKPAAFPTAVNFKWGNDINSNVKVQSAVEVLKYIYQHSSDSIHYVCLGSLNIINKAEQEVTRFKSRTSEIVWSCSNFNQQECFNNSLDKDAYKKAAKLNIPIKLINGKSLRNEAFNNTFTNQVTLIPVAYAGEINRSLQLDHKMFYDEIIPLWLHFPQYFTTTVSNKLEFISLKETVTDAELQNSFLQIVAGETINQNQVINFSWRKEDYFPDVQPIMDETVKKYGKAEWIAEAMANELHRHLGVFAIVGTKMGIRAKEYFNAGIDEMKITSYAGTIPPFSCMNDGLQVSTGATVGHGLISVSADTLVRPVADFTYMGRTIRVSLKPEYGKKIASEVKELNSIYGLNSNIYWELIRKLAIKYWANFDRHEIFTVEEL